MKIDTRNEIIRVLYSAMKKAEKIESIEDKKKFYFDYLEKALMILDIDEEIDFESEELEELISDNFLNIEIRKPQLFEGEGYIPWLEDERKSIAWNFYDRYENYLISYKGWMPSAVGSIKQSSDIILDHIANPKTDKLFQKKGLVVGDIQSGKTANYTAVINKAIDAGYKIIIVLAGLTRDLRNQTQNRLDSEVLGYETKTNGKGKAIGVGLIKPLNIEGLTYSDEERDYGDMKKYFSTHTLDKNLNPIVAIVKKNTSVLTNLHKFLISSQDYCYTDKKLDIPVLIIDDEVDQASVDTKNSDSKEGASAINKKIRIILDSLNRYSYVGYTATPFANVFIDPDKNDIYPKDFILNIPSNPGYCGIKEYFGVDVIDEDDDTSDHVTDLFVNIEDYGELFNNEKRVNAETITSGLNNSLKEAIKSFIIAASIKKQRGIIGNNSMLIHIARFKNPATSLKPLVNDYLKELYHELRYSYYTIEKEFKNFWCQKFKSVSQRRLSQEFNDDWDKISQHLLDTVESALLNIKVLNGDSADILDYSLAKAGDYIIIGGDKLSRGLTLEGLIISYYYRNSKMYDSLLQMGRWFGYRKGWLDICRVFTTIKFMNDFISVGKVLQRFKADVEDMYIQNLNPREVGQRIMYSSNLIPTARNKMKNATKLKVSFSGQVQQVITFDKNLTKQNFDITDKFLRSLGEGEVRENNKVVFKNIKPQQIIKYLEEYKDCNSYFGYGHISVTNWINYIKKLLTLGELSNWTVVLSSLATKNLSNAVNIGGYTIYKYSRKLRESGDSSNFEFYTIKVNTDPKDFKEIFPENSNNYKNVDRYDSKIDYPEFTANDAILSIYVSDLYEKHLIGDIDPKTNKQKAVKGPLVENGISVCAPAIWFPKTNDFEASATAYYVSKDYEERERKQLEMDEVEFGGED